MSGLFVKKPRHHLFLLPSEVQVARDKLCELEAVYGERVWAPRYLAPDWEKHPDAQGYWEMLYTRLWQCNHDSTHPLFDPLTVWWEEEKALQAAVREVALTWRHRTEGAWVESDLMMLVFHRYQWVYVERAHAHLFPGRLPYSYKQDAYRWSYNNWVRWALPHIGKIAPDFLNTLQRDTLYISEPLGEGKVRSRAL